MVIENIQVKGSIPTSSLLRQVGNTPLLTLYRITAALPSEVSVEVKAEWHNPSGSVKDRPAASILMEALDRGELAGGKTLLDSTSGNMGIAYATLCAGLGIPVHLAIPENASPERLQILQTLGAQFTLTDPLEGSDGARLIAGEMARQDPEGYFFADQYRNPANWRAHYNTTGPEVYRQTAGEITHFVAGLGTTGTVVGAGRYLKGKDPSVQIIGVLPDSPMHGLEGLKHLPTSPVPEIYDPNVPDEVLSISTEEAYEITRKLASQEGLLVGVSSGAAVAAALVLGRRLEQGRIVVILPDSGLKYLSAPFWRSG